MAFQIQAIFGTGFSAIEQDKINMAIADWAKFLSQNDFATIPAGTEASVFQPNATGVPAPQLIPLPQIDDILIYIYKTPINSPARAVPGIIPDLKMSGQPNTNDANYNFAREGGIKFQPTVGSLFFDANTDFITSAGYDPYTVAKHEIAHLLGFYNNTRIDPRSPSGQIRNAYVQLTDRATQSFLGFNARSTNGGTNVPMASNQGSTALDHIAYGTFSSLIQPTSLSSGTNVEVLMVPGYAPGPLLLEKGTTKLDIAVLADVGYAVSGQGFTTLNLANPAATNPNISSGFIAAGTPNGEIINGAQGGDYLAGGPGSDTINGGKGNDSLYGGVDNDSLVGGDGDDYLDGGPGKDTIDGGKGNDTVKIDPSDPIVINVENRQAAAGSDGNDTLYGSRGNDIIRGGNDADRLEGLEGNDTLYGGGTQGETTAGSDALYGGDGTDLLVANITFAVTQKDLPSSTYTAGEDTLDGGIGNDTLLGGTNTADKTTMYGGDGNDTIVAQSGQAFMFGGIGNDSIRGGSNTTFNGNIANGDDGNDTLEAGSGGMAGSGGAGDDVLIGGTTKDYFWGNSGNDKLFAKGDGDTLEGNMGNDTLQADGNNTFLLGADLRTTNPGLNEIDVLIGSPTGTTNFALGNRNVFWVGGGDADYALIQGFKTGDYLQTVNVGSSYSATQIGTNINIAYNGDLIATVENYSNLDYIKGILRIP